MKKDQVYAVVDLETTGTNPKDDRIIQFGCVFIQNNQIISRYASDINPERDFSKQIETLTGLSNERVSTAPTFKEVAKEIYDMLQGTVFVAHNIAFDYQFLSTELIRCEQPALNLLGIDTVELAQIFLPTSASFRLSDLADEFGFSHDNPHQADSDAEATANLLMMIEKKIMTLPLTTMDTIVSLASCCEMNTGEYLDMLTVEMVRELPPLNPTIQVVDGIALQKKGKPTLNWYQPNQDAFPKDKKQKQKIYGKTLDYRPGQSKMMNFADRFFTSRVTEETEINDRFAGKNLAIESSTGSGKTLGYLFPLSYIATPDKPAVISTVSVFLENQILEKDIPKINELRPGSVRATLLKSQQRFIDLSRFSNTLKKRSEPKQYVLYQMKILVWLTETITGDLDELQLTTMNHPFFKEISHRGLTYLSKRSPFYPVDFWLHLQEKVATSNIIIVNHSFLCQENNRQASLLPDTDILVVDEAHHLPETAQHAASKQLNSYDVSRTLNKMIAELDDSDGLRELAETGNWSKEYQLLHQLATELSVAFGDYKEDIFENLLIDHGYQSGSDLIVTNELLLKMPIYTQRHGQQLLQALDEAINLSNQIEESYVQQIERWSKRDHELLSSYFEVINQLSEFQQLLSAFINPNAIDCVRWLQLNEHNHQLTAYFSDFNSATVIDSKWYRKFNKILYTGGTIRVGKDTQFLARELGIEYLPFKSVPSSYDYSQQARLYVPTETAEFQELSSQAYSRFVGDTISELMKVEKRSVLVLFTSHQMLQTVYHQINQPMINEGVEVLAQGLSGSREKIVKRFEHNDQSILLGTDSFWEGLDLPGDRLELLVVTRLPFDSPERPFIKEKYQYLQSKGVDSFYKYALPKAALRLRQGIGRLIRSDEDKGAMIVLDRRLTQASYGEMLQKALPADLVIKELSLKESLKDIQDFL
ncbi:DNA polymerase III subunit epsilon [Vagococcus coleopterorum]|uniref:3'-5' exonuclease DinG n=1 Tax=Vagococcus coleopterorum TaxID=2714946 RepID=A0A6G8AN49_9ENTE|nr:helicase C-terminal domain-containing protein [Vagococcus coleopterorum]QIL46504.1 DNA polymerase III subunit epsilon [Vagococcus coleopterorum]